MGVLQSSVFTMIVRFDEGSVTHRHVTYRSERRISVTGNATRGAPLMVHRHEANGITY
jgi:hypothetical protein